MTQLVRMTEAEFAAYRAEALPAYAADKVAAGQWAAEAALALSAASFADELPAGLQTPDNHLFTIVDAVAGAVGMLWIAARQRGADRIAYVFDVAVQPQFRRQGHAMRAFQALEREVHALGLAGIALHVFGHNLGAQALYTRLGFVPTNINMYKALPAAPDVSAG
jgi:ribosomal protein S18 acetylase RimI-like enzyme